MSTDSPHDSESTGKHAIPFSFKLTAVLIIAASILLNVAMQPRQAVPNGFDQPLKYRFICFMSDIMSSFARVLHYMDIVHRVNVTRAAYYIAIGVFNIRDTHDNIHVFDEHIGHVPIRKYKPLLAAQTPVSNSTSNSPDLMPTIIFFHGGGYFLGSADVFEPVTYLLAKYTKMLVIYVEYRLIPEYTFPAALEDCLMAATHLVTNNAQHSIDLNNLVIMGDSAGGNLAMVVSRKLIEANLAKPKLQVLIYPILQFFDFTLPSYRVHLANRVLANIDHENFKNFIHYFTGIEVDDTIFANGHTSQMQKESQLAEYVSSELLPHKLRNHSLDQVTQLNSTIDMHNELSAILLRSDVSPLLVDDRVLQTQSPDDTYLVTVEMDIIRDDGFILAERLRRVDKSVEHKHYENMFHGLFGLLHGPIEFKQSHVIMEDCAKYINKVIHKVNP